MWVLSTDRAELHFFVSPEDIPEEYAALSHVWNKPKDGPPEQSFQDIRRIQEICAKDDTNPRDFVSEKIRRCCELAEKHGYKWVWIDTCCIDKTSSAELSEAINSMFHYYSLASICYGYLRNVDAMFSSQRNVERKRNSPLPDFRERYNAIRGSIWFWRGWTLQELIAPRFFVFLSRSWEVIGTKADFAELLEADLNIPADVLRLKASHSDFGIAQRMSWFGRRETTRPEDQAYCLLGLFQIHMPPLYGEGNNAFRRLQEEIMKQSADTTLFAWVGPSSSLFATAPGHFSQDWLQVVYKPPPAKQTQVPTNASDSDNDSALEMQGGARDVDDMTFTVTPAGVRAYMPIFTYDGRVFGDLYWSDARSGRRVFLRLEPDPDVTTSSRRPSYRVLNPRLAAVYQGDYGSDACHPPDGPIPWKEVLIRHRPPLYLEHDTSPEFLMSRAIPAIPMHLALDAPVRFSEARIKQFSVDCESPYEMRGAGLQSPWAVDSSTPTAYVFKRHIPGYDSSFVIIKVGQCQRHLGQRQRRPTVWATAIDDSVYMSDAEDATMNEAELEETISDFAADPTHDCSRDHVARWPGLRKRFELNHYGRIQFATRIEGVTMTLSFAPCPINPERTLVLEASYRRWGR